MVMFTLKNISYFIVFLAALIFMPVETSILCLGGIVVYYISVQGIEPEPRPISNDDSGNRKLPGNVINIPQPTDKPTDVKNKITWH